MVKLHTDRWVEGTFRWELFDKISNQQSELGIQPNPRPLNPTPIVTRLAQLHANQGGAGMVIYKPFGILVEAQGGGVQPSGDLVIGTSGDRKPKPTPMEDKSLKPAPIWDGVGCFRESPLES